MFENILQGALYDEPQKEEKKKTKKKTEKIKTDQTKNIYDSSMDAGAGELPTDLITVFESIVDSYCNKYGIESPQKMSGQQWRSACYMIGEYIKTNNIIVDTVKSCAQGGRVYDADKVDKIVSIYGYMCGNYKKTPLKSDFVNFAGVSSSWLYDCNGACSLTSASGNILKKLSDLQEAGIASGIVNDNGAPVGKMFFSKCFLGWSESGVVKNNIEENNEKSQGLPDLALLSLPNSEKQ